MAKNAPFSVTPLSHTHDALARLWLCSAPPPTVPPAPHSAPPAPRAPAAASATSSPALADGCPYLQTLFDTCRNTTVI